MYVNAYELVPHLKYAVLELRFVVLQMLLPKRIEEISNNFVVWISSNSNNCDKFFTEFAYSNKSRTTGPHVRIRKLNHKCSLIFTVEIVYNILDITLLKIRI
jgi:hypothetical protein